MSFIDRSNQIGLASSQPEPAAPPALTDAECHTVMTDLPFAAIASGLDPATSQAILNYAGMLRRDGLSFIQAGLDGRIGTVIRLLLTVTRDAGYVRTEQVNANLTADIKGDGGLTIACRAGCAACCHVNIEVTIPEAILVALAISTKDDPRQAAVQAAAAALSGLDQGARVRSGLPCPLLDANNACSVYDVRPISCRSFLAPSAERCHSALENAVQGKGDDTIEWHIMPRLFGQGHKAGLSGIIKDLGLQYDMVDLVQAVARLLREPDLIHRWASGETVFQAYGHGRA